MKSLPSAASGMVSRSMPCTALHALILKMGDLTSAAAWRHTTHVVSTSGEAECACLFWHPQTLEPGHRLPQYEYNPAEGPCGAGVMMETCVSLCGLELSRWRSSRHFQSSRDVKRTLIVCMIRRMVGRASAEVVISRSESKSQRWVYRRIVMGWSACFQKSVLKPMNCVVAIQEDVNRVACEDVVPPPS